MKRLLLLITLLFLLTTTSWAQQIQGTWHGELHLNEMRLNLVFHIDGDSICTLDSPDQGAKGIKGVVKELTSEKVNLQFPLLLAAYTGELKDGKLVGTFKQRDFSLPLTLSAGELVRQRPQTPLPPFPYETFEVTFPSADSSANTPMLAGTLTLPADYSPNKTPCLLLITGSGLQNRDEEIFDHKPFAVIADYLARNGIASLRYDDRGFGQSTGDPQFATTANFTLDAAGALHFLRTLSTSSLKNGSNAGSLVPAGSNSLPFREGMGVGSFFPSIGILGHSEGGTIAFMLGAKQLPDFIIALAAPGIKGDTLIVEQTNALLTFNGKPANMTVRTMHIMMAMQEQNAWYQFFIDYDPSADIAATRCPILAINGSLDTQVLPNSNLTAIQQLANLRPWNNGESLPSLQGGAGRGLFKLYPGLNHLFQHATTGNPTEYGITEETISHEVLHDIVEWINSLR
ncbi:MAG: lysophospholipase [Prevotella sp.]|nr:lysophospholipase [Prevotella sp.]